MVGGATIAVIPARGGSTRIPRKNIIDFGGRPMITWTIEAALQTDLFDRVLVSTDDEEIAGIAEATGAETPFLRDRAADTVSLVAEATLAALAQAEAHWQQPFETVVQLMPNCPLRGVAEINTIVDRFRHTGAPFVLSCFRYGWMNPWWAHRLDSEGRGTPLFEGTTARNSQDLDPLYCPTGAVWAANVGDLRDSRSFYGPGHLFQPIDWRAAVDIDDEVDLEMARALLAIANSGRKDS